MSVLRSTRVLASLVVLAACSGSVEPGPSTPVGSYILESVVGRGPSNGEMVLSHSGNVSRSVRYTQPNGTLSTAYVAIGTYTATDSETLHLGLRENGGKSQYVWNVTATYKDGVLSLGYPDPGDGWIVENYRRQ
jgi:hypothetical protein